MNAIGTARRISVAAMLIALSLVISLLPSLPGSITKFGGFPLLLGGFLIGPRTGFAVGCITDLIGFVLRPTGPFFPGFTITQGLTCMIPGLLSRGRDPYTWLPIGDDVGYPEGGPVGGDVVAFLRFVAIFGITQAITSVFLVSVFTSQIVQGTPFLYELGSRAFAQLTHVPIYAFLALSVLKALAQTDVYKKLLKSRK